MNIKALLVLLLITISFTINATVIDSFQTTQQADGVFIDASETISGNRLFALDGPFANGSLGNGQLQCEIRSTEEEDSVCSVIYNAATEPLDLTENGLNAGIRIHVSELVGSVDVGLQLTDQNDVTSIGLVPLSAGENTILFSELFGLTGTPNYRQIKGILVIFSGDESLSTGRFNVNLIETLTGDGMSGNGAAEITLNSRYSGSFFDASRDGEGIQFIVLPDNETVALSWYTYLDGQQVWLVGAGRMTQTPATIELTITSGAEYGEAFNPNDVNRTVWGSLTMDLIDCNTMQLQASTILPEFQNIDIQMARIVSANCAQIDEPLGSQANDLLFQNTGSYFAPSRDGEGMQISVESDAQTVLASWYTYLNGEQVWMVGAGRINQNQVTMQATITQGADFGERFDPADVVRSNWGIWQIQFVDCNNIELIANPSLTEFQPITIAMTKVAIPSICG